jgi:hypothetical protein
MSAVEVAQFFTKVSGSKSIQCEVRAERIMAVRFIWPLICRTPQASIPRPS